MFIRRFYQPTMKKKDKINIELPIPCMFYCGLSMALVPSMKQ